MCFTRLDSRGKIKPLSETYGNAACTTALIGFAVIKASVEARRSSTPPETMYCPEHPVGPCGGSGRFAHQPVNRRSYPITPPGSYGLYPRNPMPA
ncbi:hypothetical protein O1611_g986 [Lasiodiplodia mahajangana]|uniref:Uncharacterized protein n=1 Tax=Lasiodiplodia mahajangana TaxID=1108764 RepID=A0ACC2JYM8_9PEZI|nr:hypothetical protein O1611_g986 [Lasiodiplodia mahajangana]